MGEHLYDLKGKGLRLSMAISEGNAMQRNPSFDAVIQCDLNNSSSVLYDLMSRFIQTVLVCSIGMFDLA